MLPNRPAAPAMAHSSRLEGRVRSILAYLPTRPSRRAGLSIALLTLVALPILAARPAASQDSDALKTPGNTFIQGNATKVPAGKVPEKPLSPAPTLLSVDKTPPQNNKQIVKWNVPATRNQAQQTANEKRQSTPTSDKVPRPAPHQASDHVLWQTAQKRDLLLKNQRAENSPPTADTTSEGSFDLSNRNAALREEMDELRLKLRNLDSRLTDKKLELVAIAESSSAAKGIQNQIKVLEQMIEETRRQREKVRSVLNDVAHQQHAMDQMARKDDVKRQMAVLEAQMNQLEDARQKQKDRVNAGVATNDELEKIETQLVDIRTRYEAAKSQLDQLQ